MNKMYLEKLQIGMVISFNVSTNKMLSGKIIQINDENVEVETRKGTKFKVLKNDITWVKTGQRWPKGIYEKLKSNII
jgi:preprotein translocase subunit YajC